MSIHSLQETLGNLIDDIGVAYPDEVVDSHRPYPCKLLPDAKSVIVHLTSLQKTINRYKHGGWWVNRYLHVKHDNELIEDYLRETNFNSFAPSPYGSNPNNAVAKISFKLAGVKAGLGNWGRNHLLIHPEFGPRVVLGVILTDARFSHTKRKPKSLCNGCFLCIEACPLKAISPSGEIDRMKCFHRNKYLSSPCRFLCMRRCPVGLDYEC